MPVNYTSRPRKLSRKLTSHVFLRDNKQMLTSQTVWGLLEPPSGVVSSERRMLFTSSGKTCHGRKLCKSHEMVMKQKKNASDTNDVNGIKAATPDTAYGRRRLKSSYSEVLTLYPKFNTLLLKPER